MNDIQIELVDILEKIKHPRRYVYISSFTSSEDSSIILECLSEIKVTIKNNEELQNKIIELEENLKFHKDKLEKLKEQIGEAQEALAWSFP